MNTPDSFTSVTVELSFTTTPNCSKKWLALSRKAGAKLGRMHSPPSNRRTVKSSARRAGKSKAMASRASCARAPANSTPVGPPPTTTKVRYFRASDVWRTRSARSNDRIRRSRMVSASDRVFKPGANCSQSSFPKYQWRDPGATMRNSKGIASPSANSTTRRSRSTAITSPITTRTFRCPRRMLRNGEAMSAGESAAVATW